MDPPGWFRLTRSLVFAVMCVSLSLTGHQLMAARSVPLWADGVALAGLTVVGCRLADRRRSLAWLLPAVETVQFCLHLWFEWATPGIPAEHLTMVTDGGGHYVMHGAVHDSATPWGMIVAHVLAGGLVAVWLALGESAAWRLLGILAEVLFGPVRRVLALLARPCRPVEGRLVLRPSSEDEYAVPSDRSLRHVLVRRGPPSAGRLQNVM